MAIDRKKIELFRQAAISKGYKPEQVNAFIGSMGIPIGTEAVSEIMKQGGSSFINKGKSKDERISIAEEILNSGGLSEYRKALPLTDLADDKEKEGLTATTDLLSKIDRALPSMQKDTIGGTGPLAQFIPGFLGTTEGREARATPEMVRAAYQQMISGKVVSEQEAKRLARFLPTKGKTETQNREDLQRLKDGIDLNLQLFEKGKREGLTTNEAYTKYGKDILKEQLGKKDETPKTLMDILTKPPPGSPSEYVPQEAMSAALGPIGALFTGTERQKAMAGPAVLAGAIPAGGAALGLGKAGLSALGSLISPSAIAAGRTAAAQKVTDLSNEPIVEAIKQHVEDDPESKEIGKSILKSVKNPTLGAEDLLRKMQVWKKAYTVRGDVRPGKEIFNTAYQAGKKILEEKAPEVAAKTARLRFLYEAPKQAQRLSWLALKGTAIGKMLGL